jgi:myo-inositol 2-dehydrogenase / D-chiro-inositol 1-dehydrogenase
MVKLGVGVLGVGAMGMQHARNLRALIPDARLIAVADADLPRAQNAASELELERYCTSIEELVALADVRAVVIATPAKFHGAAVRVCAEARKDIFCEKPDEPPNVDALDGRQAVAAAAEKSYREKRAVRVENRKR